MKKNHKLTPYLLLLPLLPIFIIFFVGLAQGILGSFGYIPAFGLDNFTLSYFREIFSDSQLLKSIGLSLYISLSSAVIITIQAALLAFCLKMLKKTGGITYALIKIPMFIPWMVTGLIMIQLFSQSGFVSRVFYGIGLERASQEMGNLLYKPHHFGVIIAFVWAGTPFALFLILTVMSNISEEIIEAAQNQGANLGQILRYILMPLSKPMIRSVFLIMLVSCFGCYEIPALLGMTAPRALPVEIFYQYNHFDLKHRPYAMALNTIMLLLSLTMVLALHLWAGYKERRDSTYDQIK